MNVSLTDAVREGTVTFRLRGAGPGVTSSCIIDLTATGDAVLDVVVGRGTQFAPDQSRFQNMEATEDTVVRVDPGTAAPTSVTIRTLCVSRFGRMPPPADGSVDYTIVSNGSPVAAVLEAVDGVAERLQELAASAAMPTDVFVHAVTQHTVWVLLEGDRDATDGDIPRFDQQAVTSIVASQLPGDRPEQVRLISDALWTGVDATLKALDGHVTDPLATPTEPATEP